MKIEIDLNDILGDEYGTETMQESIKRQIVDRLSAKMAEGISNKIDSAITKLINEEIKAAVTIQMPNIVNDLLDAEFKTVDKWGDKSKEKTTVRKTLVETVTSEMQYKKAGYSSDKNVFTRAVDDIISENLKIFQKDFDAKINADFSQAAMHYAATELQKKLGIKSNN